MTTRRIVAAAVGTSAILAGTTATASADTPSTKLAHRYQAAYAKAQKHGATPGRNILLQGVATKRGIRAARAGEVRNSASVLERMTVPATATAASGTAPSAALQAIAQCESGGNPAAVDASGTYRGKYQFDMGTWAANGGTGDPAAAPEAEQDAIAARLYAARGAAPWPVCGS
ncbi:MAG: hypothetical protein QOF76_2442 [Solirubrobacteraceae bacterium]|nr:hypothetical protein [Solirubrobacteraceae bacterium]